MAVDPGTFISAGGAGPWLTATVTVTSPEILALFTTPKELIPAPGAGKLLLLVSGTVHNDVGSIVYDVPGSSPATIAYAAQVSSGIRGISADFLESSFDLIQGLNFLQGLSGATIDNSATHPNEAIVLRGNTTNPTLGNGEWKFSLVYRIIEVDL